MLFSFLFIYYCDIRERALIVNTINDYHSDNVDFVWREAEKKSRFKK